MLVENFRWLCLHSWLISLGVRFNRRALFRFKRLIQTIRLHLKVQEIRLSIPMTTIPTLSMERTDLLQAVTLQVITTENPILSVRVYLLKLKNEKDLY